jgi:argininosuccinate synthase
LRAVKRIEAKKIVVAYSGGLDTSVIIGWLREHSSAEIVAWTADIGQGEELAHLDEKAKQTGASKLVVEDLRERFVKEFVFPALRANAVYEGAYLLGTSLARPIIGRRLVECARAEGADAICHGATGKGNDQVRFELTAYAFVPGIQVIAPWRMWNMKGRADLIDYAAKHAIPVTATKEKPYSTDRNLFHISYEGGVLEDPWREPEDPVDVPPHHRAREGAGRTRVRRGRLRARRAGGGGRPGPGRGRAAREAQRAGRQARRGSRRHRREPLRGHEVARRVRDAGRHHPARRSPRHRADHDGPRGPPPARLAHPEYAKLVYNGFWYAPERELLQSMIDQTQENVTGTARLKLYKGSVTIVGRKAPRSLWSPAHASFEAENVYNQADAEGFIKLNALRLRIRRSAGLGPLEDIG